MIRYTSEENTYNMIMSLEALALSANSWQLTTLKPYPSHEYPLTSMVSMWIWSCPVFSTLNVLFNVKFGSLSFKSKGKKKSRVNINLACSPDSMNICQTLWTTSSCQRDQLVPSFHQKYSTLLCHFRHQSLIMLYFPYSE